LIVEDEPELLHRFSQAVLADESLTLTAAVSNGASAIAVLGVWAAEDFRRPLRETAVSAGAAWRSDVDATASAAGWAEAGREGV
jgi:hypothetical protein